MRLSCTGPSETVSRTLLANFFSPVDKCEHQRRAKQEMLSKGRSADHNLALGALYHSEPALTALPVNSDPFIHVLVSKALAWSQMRLWPAYGGLTHQFGAYTTGGGGLCEYE